MEGARDVFGNPATFSSAELEAFARLVTQGFHVVDEAGLAQRIRAAACLGFHSDPAGEPVAVAALKAPPETYRVEVFAKAAVAADPRAHTLELGWVFVLPSHRRRGLAVSLCRGLLERAGAASLFATSRTDNTPMHRILHTLGFHRAGRPYPRRNEELALFLRSGR